MKVQPERVLQTLPVFTTSAEVTEWTSLRVTGLVADSLLLDLDRLAKLPQDTLVEDFHCTHGWVVPELQWEGVHLKSILEMAGPLSNATYVSVTAGDYRMGFSLYDVYTTKILVALKLNGETLTPDHGYPCRLIASGKLCHYSVKWIETIEITDRPPEDIGTAIAASRAGQP